MMPQLPRHLVLSALLFSLAVGVLGSTGSHAQSVVINGVPLATTRSPVNFGGSILLPMRDVFEALNSEVKWFAPQQMIMATRGNTAIQLWIGKRTATVNGQEVSLPVAPMLMAGSTYVPLRFPAEAFNGKVEWQAATRTVVIDIPPAGEPGPVTPGPGTPPPARTVEGMVIQVIATPAGVLLQPADGGLQAVSLKQDTVITRGVAGEQAAPAALADVRPGDYAVAELAEGNMASRLTLSFGRASGNVVAIAGNTLVFEDGTALRLSDNVRVFNAAGQPAPLTSVAQNTQAEVVFEPRSRLVWEIRVAAAPPTPQPPPAQQQPQILTLGLLNNTPYFRRGDIMRVQLTGTPGGEAAANLGRLTRDLALREVQPGVYQAEFTVPGVQNLQNQSVTGNLSVGGRRAQTVVSNTRFVVDNTPPVITAMLPAAGQVVNNNSPMIDLTFEGRGGAPLDPRSARMSVNRVDVSAFVIADEDNMSYTAENLPAGNVTVEAAVEDLAGNEARVTWSFSIGQGTNNVIEAVWHEAQNVLVAGNALTVSARVVTAGGQASFGLGNLRANLPMARVGDSKTYRGVYVVQAGDRLVDGLVTVTYRDPQGRQGTMDATTRVQIDTGLPNALRITLPADQSAAGDVIMVSGEAPPNARVRVTISYRTRVLTTITGQLWQGVVTASRAGVWQTPDVGSSVGFLGRADEYTILAELLDANGNVLARQQVKQHK